LGPALAKANFALLPVEPCCTYSHTLSLQKHVGYSTDSPLLAQEASKACRVGGRILLLEHGRSHYDWLNRMLDDGADRHCRRWACSWNLPIDEIVQQAGLNVVSSSRWHFGTTYVIIAEPGRHHQCYRSD